MTHTHKANRPTANRLAAGFLGVASVGLALSACGTTTKTASTISATGPAGDLAASVSALGSQSSIKATFSIPVTASQAAQLASMGPTKAPNTGFATALSTGSVFFAEQTGKGESLDSTTASSDTGNSYDFGVTFGSNTPLEIRYVGQSLYLHLQASTLMTDLGQPASKATSIDNELLKLNADVPGLSALANGGWVEISHTTLGPLLSELKGFASLGAGSTSSSSSNVGSTLLGLRTNILAAIKANSTVTSLSPGSTGGRQEYAVNVKAQPVAASLNTALNSAGALIPSIGNKLGGLSKSLASVPSNFVVTIDAYTSSGKLSEADLNLDQFATKTKPSLPVPLRMTVSTATISAPSGATQLDLSKLPSMLGGVISKLG